MLDRPEATEKAMGHSNPDTHDVNGHWQKTRRPKPSSYVKEVQMAEQSRHKAHARNRQREERDKDRRAMSKARRPDKDGKYRLGRQSNILLSRVKRLVAEG
jgi:neutral trehalase